MAHDLITCKNLNILGILGSLWVSPYILSIHMFIPAIAMVIN